MSVSDEIRAFIEDAKAKAEATTDAQIRTTAESTSGHPGGTIYSLGLRDGVVMACEQVLTKLDELTALDGSHPATEDVTLDA